LRPNNTLEWVRVECINPDTDRKQMFNMQVSETQAPINGLMLPTRIQTCWDNEPFFEVEPTVVDTNPQFTDGLFTLSAEK
ncbi:MAG: hypothetical protein U0694_24105, partial [Anaerolineae bacterium]